jgi:hypothetical protein
VPLKSASNPDVVVPIPVNTTAPSPIQNYQGSSACVEVAATERERRAVVVLVPVELLPGEQVARRRAPPTSLLFVEIKPKRLVDEGGDTVSLGSSG